VNFQNNTVLYNDSAEQKEDTQVIKYTEEDKELKKHTLGEQEKL
jgi:hypothetical protein